MSDDDFIKKFKKPTKKELHDRIFKLAFEIFREFSEIEEKIMENKEEVIKSLLELREIKIKEL